VSKELGKHCLVEDCEEDAEHLKKDGDLIVSVCKNHAEELDKDTNLGDSKDE